MSKPYEISGDGRSVWINFAGQCLARVSPDIGEIFPTPHTSERLIPADWRRWAQRVKEIHGIDVQEEHQPRWAR